MSRPRQKDGRELSGTWPLAQRYNVYTNEANCRWKLLLRPDYLPLPAGFRTAPLPDGLKVEDVFRDQFAYVKNNLRRFLAKTHGFNEATIAELEASMYIVLTTPNGWEGRHQNRMREAALDAGFLNRVSRHRIKFVSEGEVRH